MEITKFNELRETSDGTRSKNKEKVYKCYLN